jgi:hypothetical protein
MTTKKAAKKKASKKKAAKKTTGRKPRTTVDWSSIPLSTTQFAQLLNINPARVSEFTSKGMPACTARVRGSHTNIYLDKALPWVIQRIRRGTEAEGPQERLWTAKARHQELTNAREEKTLVYTHHVAHVFGNAISALKSAAAGFAGRVCNQLAGMDNPAEIRIFLLSESRQFQTAFSDELKKIAEEGVTLADSIDDE